MQSLRTNSGYSGLPTNDQLGEAFGLAVGARQAAYWNKNN